MHATLHAARSFCTRCLRRLWRGALALLLGLLLAGFLLLGLGLALLSVLWSLLRGKKPALVSVFQRFQQASRAWRGAAGPASRAGAASAGVEVVDVQAREVRTVAPALTSRSEL